LTSKKVDVIFKLRGEGQNPPEKQEERGLEILLFEKEANL